MIVDDSITVSPPLLPRELLIWEWRIGRKRSKSKSVKEKQGQKKDSIGSRHSRKMDQEIR
ncbi:MAG: hypothetical protein ACMUEL_09035 [Flavobacteriales bacterium Tduv]